METGAERPIEKAATPVGGGVKPAGSGRPNRGRMTGPALRVRLSAEERAAFGRVAASYGMPIADYVRSMALDPAALRRDELKRILGVIGRISNRINIMAKRIDTDGGPIPQDLTLICKEVSDMHDAVMKALAGA